MEGKTQATAATPEGEKPRRVIKRYSNRKLYDTKDSRYVTLLQIAEMVRTGEEVQIIDNNTKEDLTEVTLAQIIYEEQKENRKSVPLQTLKDLIHQRTEKVLHDLRETPIGRLIPGSKDEEGGEATADGAAAAAPAPQGSTPPGAAGKDGKVPFVAQARETIEAWQHQIDERVKALTPSLVPWGELQTDVKKLAARLDALEARLSKLESR